MRSFGAGRAWPVWLGLGWGLGNGYADWERIASPATLPNVRVLPAGSPEASTLAPPQGTFQLLQQRSGQILAQARQASSQFGSRAADKASDAKVDAADTAKEAKDKVR